MIRIRGFTRSSLQLNACFDVFAYIMPRFDASSCRFVVLVSGQGSNLCALHRAMVPVLDPATLDRSIFDAVSGQNADAFKASAKDSVMGSNTVSVVGVISNRPLAQALVWAQEQGIPTEVVDHRSYGSREEFDVALSQAIDTFQPDFILLAGFMRILTPEFVTTYLGRLINIHPSLLPALPGLHTHARALEAGLLQHGCTVHFVTPELDHGPMIAQGVINIGPQDTVESLAQRVQKIEHIVYPTVARWLADGLVSLTSDQTVHIKNVTQRLFLESSP
jgi:phosphoribosylglycinamide formyltransferase-1